MTVSWFLTTTSLCRVATIMGRADDHEAAITEVLAAAQAAIDDARVTAAPAARYELRAAGEPVAIVQTGADEDGNPDHVSTRELIQRIEWQRYLSAAPY